MYVVGRQRVIGRDRHGLGVPKNPECKDAVTDKALLQPEGEPLWGLREIILGVQEQPPAGVLRVLDHGECGSRRARERDAANEAMQCLRRIVGTGFRKMVRPIGSVPRGGIARCNKGCNPPYHLGLSQ